MSDKAMFHQSGTLVIEDELTGETEEPRSILGKLQEELENLEDEIDKATEKKDKHSKRKLRRRFMRSNGNLMKLRKRSKN